MGSYISSLNNFATQGIAFVTSVIQDGVGLTKTTDTSAGLTPGLAANDTTVFPSGGSLLTAMQGAGIATYDTPTATWHQDVYAFHMSTTGGGAVNKVSAIVLDSSKAAKINQDITGLTIQFDTDALVAGIGEPGGAGTASGAVTLTLQAAPQVVYPDSTKFWNNECVSVYAGGAAGNLVGVLANDVGPITISTSGGAGFLEFAFKSIDSTSTTSANLILIQ